MVDWSKIIANAFVTGAITALTLFATSGGSNAEASILSAAIAGAIAFFVELKKATAPVVTAGTRKASKLTLF